MSQMVKCTKCGAGIDPGAQFCSGCGADVTGPQGTAATAHIKVSAAQAMEAQLLEALRDATLGDYEVLTQLGQGGMATVYLAHDISLDRKVAIKVMNPALVTGEGMVERFKLEARTSAGLSHPHIIPIYAVKETDHLLFFVMKFIDGRPLDSIIKEAAPLPIPMVRTVVTKVGEALGYAHRRGVVHRDIKPANIMIDSEGMPIVTDFGIAKVADKQGLTMTGATIGTPTYMSPEQCNALEITGASDQYSLGVLAYEMLTGRPLYDGDSVMTIMFKHVHDEPPAPAALGPHVPADLAAAITKMLQKEPSNRWPSIEDSLQMLSGGQAAYDDSVRTALIEFAKHSPNREILDRVSTPRSPIPAGAAAMDSAATVRLSSGSQPSARTAASAPPKKKSRTGLWLGLGGIVVAGAAAAFVFLGPLAQRGDGDGPTQAGGTDLAIGQEPPATPATAAPDSTAGGDTTSPATPPAAAASTPVEASGPAPVRAVRIANAPGSMTVGQSVTLTASVIDANNRQVSRRPNWRSTNNAVVQVSPSGVVQAIGTGQATITATAENRSDQVTITVSDIPVANVAVSPANRTLTEGETLQLSVTLTASNGVSLANRAVAWTSSNPAVASVTPSGLVTANGAGNATIAAASGSASGVSTITVSAPVTAVTPPPVAIDHQGLIRQAIQDYARALEAKDISRVKTVYPSLPAQREQQLQDALRNMERLSVNLEIGDIMVSGERATAEVDGTWNYRSDGSNRSLPAKNTYELSLRGNRWVITAIR